MTEHIKRILTSQAHSSFQNAVFLEQMEVYDALAQLKPSRIIFL
jgi:hypothetical protein